MSRTVRVPRVSAALFAVVAIIAAAAGSIERLIAAVGDLDPSFGIGGVATAPSGPYSAATAVAVQPDGKILAAGPNGTRTLRVARFNADGSLDTGFGTGGVVEANLSSEDVREEWPFKILLRPDGRIIVVASFDNFLSAPKVALLQYNPDGSPDTSFGSGGITRHTLSGILVGTNDAVLQPDGAVLVAGHAYFNAADYTVFTVHRFMPGGLIDPSFGTGGFVATTISRADQAWAMALQPDGRFIVAGFSQHPIHTARGDFAIARFLPDGALDPSFGTGGKLLIDPSNGVAQTSWVQDVLVQPDGRIVAAGFSWLPEDVAKGVVVRLLSDGQLDTTFSDDGIGVYKDGLSAGTYGTGRGGFHRIALQSNGRLIATTNREVAGIRPDGTLDPEFHGDGIVNVVHGDVGVDFARMPYDLAVQDDNKLVIGSTAYSAAAPGMIVMRLLAENTPPAMTPAAISLERGTSRRLTIGTAVDASDPLVNLVVSPMAATLPDGVTFTNFLINATTGAVSATVSSSCTTATGTYDVEFSITDEGHATTFATVPVTVLGNPVPALSISDETVTEGDSSPFAAALVVTASSTVCAPITVNYATTDGTAASPADYGSTSGTVTIPAGQSSAVILITVLGETVPENDETFFVNLDTPLNATIADGQGAVTILNDEPGLIQFAGTTVFDVVETDEATPAPAVNLQLVRLTGLESTATITFAVSGSATYFSDYAILGNGFVTFAPGQQEATVGISIFGDLLEEDTESATISIVEWSNASTGTPFRAQITIRDDDGAPPDVDAPAINGSVPVASNAAGWHKADLSVSLSANDGTGSGVTSISYALSGAQTQALTVVPAANVSIPIVTEGITTVAFFAEDVAGNVAATQTLLVRLDKTSPTVVITSPAMGVVYTLNQVAGAAYACADGGSGVASCAGTTAPGAPIDTATAGAKTYGATATDAAGNVAAATVSYSVVVPTPTFRLVALFDQLKEHNRGSAIPIKLQVEDAAGTNVSSPDLVVEALAVSSGTEIGAAEEEVLDAGQANPMGRFRFGSDGAYIFNLKTTNLKAGPYVLVVRIAGDPTLHAVPFLIRVP